MLRPVLRSPSITASLYSREGSPLGPDESHIIGRDEPGRHSQEARGIRRRAAPDHGAHE
jgi:hypothetical protein